MATLHAAKKSFYASLNKECKNRLAKKKVCAFPNELTPPKYFLDKGYVLGKIFHTIGISPLQFNPWKIYDVVISWQDITCDTINSEKYILDSYAHTKHLLPKQMINFGLSDISKEKVGRINKVVFGYNLDVDPQSYRGKGVIKSKFNATHDGQIVDFPISKDNLRKNKVYSILIDNEREGFVYDHRLIFMRGVLDFFYLKTRPLETRFSNTNSSASLENTSKYFSIDELQKIHRFCVEMNLDYGEIDVLRDRLSNAIYIVDVSGTPAGPPNGLTKSCKLEAIVKLSSEFSKIFLID